jgi:hypothetical protein
MLKCILIRRINEFELKDQERSTKTGKGVDKYSDQNRGKQQQTNKCQGGFLAFDERPWIRLLSVLNVHSRKLCELNR